MEPLSVFLLWIADILGIKWIRQERDRSKKAAKMIIFLIAGVFLVMIIFILFNIGSL